MTWIKPGGSPERLWEAVEGPEPWAGLASAFCEPREPMTTLYRCAGGDHAPEGTQGFAGYEHCDVKMWCDPDVIGGRPVYCPKHAPAGAKEVTVRGWQD